ncbi:MAG TPA: DsbC family protein [Steroidobacteraceae bacterium]|jgi:thiol:disulfide interchange protein DsbC|nr:DsbC family protein [Steroidobacteraceae bacterium]
MKPYAALVSLALFATVALSAPPASQQASANNSASPASPEPAAKPPSAPPSGSAPLLAVSPETLRAVAKAAGEGVKPEDVRPTPLPGIFEMRRGADVLYVSQDGKYVLVGDLYRVAGRENLTEVRRSELRRELIDQLPESKMVVFSPPNPKYTVTVFTDVDCPYCRTLHSQIDEYNRLGVKVRYVFFPRSGPDTESWYKAEQVWCSTDRRAALTQAKLGKPLDAKICANTPIAQEYELGRQIGLEGTPGIVLSDGTMIGGYMPPDKLLAQIKLQSP